MSMDCVPDAPLSTVTSVRNVTMSPQVKSPPSSDSTWGPHRPPPVEWLYDAASDAAKFRSKSPPESVNAVVAVRPSEPTART